MIYEITGQPGHGKTLYALKLARDFAREGRAVYAHGVTDLDYAKTGFLQLEDPRRWQDLPDNAVVLIDECYSVFPNRNAATAVPDYIEALARHRHRGFDFILVHQQPNQVDPFVRGLVDTHIHVRRKFGFGVAVLKTWDYSSPNPIKDPPLRAPTWKYDKTLFSLYRSATMHTVKKRLPWPVWVVPPVAAFVLWTGYRLLSGQMFADEAQASETQAAPSATAQAGVLGAAASASREDFAAWMRPRLAGLPFTAPAFDKLQPRSEPDVFCASGGEGMDAHGEHREASCTCLSEQGTVVPIEPEVCRKIAREGLYNPFREPPRDGRDAASDVAAERRASGPVPAVAALEGGPLVQPQGDFAADASAVAAGVGSLTMR